MTKSNVLVADLPRTHSLFLMRGFPREKDTADCSSSIEAHHRKRLAAPGQKFPCMRTSKSRTSGTRRPQINIHESYTFGDANKISRGAYIEVCQRFAIREEENLCEAPLPQGACSK